jgi:putative transposase
LKDRLTDIPFETARIGTEVVTMPSSDRTLALAELTDAQREEAMARFIVLQPHLERGVPLPQAAGEAGVALRTAQRWLARYHASGLAGLARLPRTDLGRRKVPTEMVEFIEGLFLRKPQPSVATIHRRVLAVAKNRQWPAPSYGSIYSIVRRLDPAMITLAHESAAIFRDRRLPWDLHPNARTARAIAVAVAARLRSR